MAVDYKDYYKILGVNKNASQQDIQKAYRKLAREHHPDVNPGDKKAEERFKEINEANEVLSDPEKRRQYDEIGRYQQQYGRWPGSSASTGYPSGGGRSTRTSTMSEEDLNDLFGGASPFSDFFETYFGSGASRTRGERARRTDRAPYGAYAPKGEDVEVDVDVTLAEAYQGKTRMFELTDADGSIHRLEIKIPAGVNEGTCIRIASQGRQGASGRGDLYLRVHILPDPRFRREGTTLYTHVDVPLTTAMLGGEVQVQVPDGRRLLLRIPAGTPNGKVFRLSGQGMSVFGKPEQRGDLHVEVRVVLPRQLNDEQRRLFEAFARSMGYANQATTA